MIVLATNISMAEGMEFFHGSFEEALAEAKKHDKVIFVDAYAVWCGPCKRMAKNVFPDETVGAFYNKYFINIKMDMERGEGLEFRKKYPVSAFPTLFYIDGSGEVVQKVKGAQNVENFIKIGKKALSLSDNSEEYAAKYEKGERDPQLVYNYVKALNKAGKPSLKIANEYFRTQKDITTEFNLKFLSEAAIEADSKLFELFLANRKAIEKLSSEKEVQERILQACEASVKKAIDFEFEDIMNDAIAIMDKEYPSEAKAFELKAKMDYSTAMQDSKSYLSAAKTYAKKVVKNDMKMLHDFAVTMTERFKNDADVMEKAEDFAKEAAKESDDYRYHLTYAHILKQNGKKEKAIKAANRAKKIAQKQNPKNVKMVESYIRRLQES